MVDTSRRQLLRATGATVLGGVGGCLGRGIGAGTEQSSTTDDSTASGSLTEWERSTDCERTPTGMHDSVIETEQVTSTIGDGYVPIQYSELSPDEQEILRTVTEEGGYGTCDTSEGFDRFVERVSTHREKQRGAVEESMHVYLVRNDTYYRLYVEDLDQVFAY